MDKRVSVTNDEIACAIIASRLPRKSMRAFFEALTSPGRKEKHAGWTRVCENIRQAKNMSMTSKGWRREAHILFMDNLVEIEQLVWNKIMQLPVDAHDTVDVYAALNSVLNSIPPDTETSNDEKTN